VLLTQLVKLWLRRRNWIWRTQVRVRWVMRGRASRRPDEPVAEIVQCGEPTSQSEVGDAFGAPKLLPRLRSEGGPEEPAP